MNYTVLGFALIAIPFLVVFIAVARTIGWKGATLIFGGALVATAMLVVGVHLVELGQALK